MIKFVMNNYPSKILEIEVYQQLKYLDHNFEVNLFCDKYQNFINYYNNKSVLNKF